MKKVWTYLGLLLAINLCIVLAVILWQGENYWKINRIYASLLFTGFIFAAAILGACGLSLLFPALRFNTRLTIPHVQNAASLGVLWLGIIVIVGMCLYPPWVQTIDLPSIHIKGTNPRGYGFLWHPPDMNGRYSGLSIDYSRLLLQIFIVGLVTGGLLYTLRTKDRNRKPTELSSP